MPYTDRGLHLLRIPELPNWVEHPQSVERPNLTLNHFQLWQFHSNFTEI
ncbi:MAG: hypothetical protein HC769_02810 [Cyanobacteria bacterium CRU_2_1]|nr:hypothetical protein [Cyanobacteria bacterium RU_5_0]NJR57871.1 hypothetical protein [Cyanobacteria bacterium CRU_2_1]